MARKSNAQPLGAVIKELLRVYGLDKKLREVDVRVAWEKVMGATIASKTRSIHLKDGVVQITLDRGLEARVQLRKDKDQRLVERRAR